jgi:serine O-acetyltransferase
MVLNDIRKIREMNSNSRALVLFLYFEKIFLIKWPFKILRRLVQKMHNCEIFPECFATINSLLTIRLPHPFLIIIHRDARIYDNVTIFQGVTIGVVERDDRDGIMPVIGNNVYIGCKATILNAAIADNCIIGAHALVLKSVPEPQTVVGIWK